MRQDPELDNSLAIDTEVIQLVLLTGTFFVARAQPQGMFAQWGREL